MKIINFGSIIAIKGTEGAHYCWFVLIPWDMQSSVNLLKDGLTGRWVEFRMMFRFFMFSSPILKKDERSGINDQGINTWLVFSVIFSHEYPIFLHHKCILWSSESLDLFRDSIIDKETFPVFWQLKLLFLVWSIREQWNWIPF